MSVNNPEWIRLYNEVLVALAPQLSAVSPSGVAHLPAELVDAAMEERRLRFGTDLTSHTTVRRPARKPTENEEIALRRTQLGLPPRRPKLHDD